MGILDALFSPQAMSAQGGLLGGYSKEDWLKYLGDQAAPTGSAGNGIDPNGYQYGPGGQQAWQQYGGAALPPNAQPAGPAQHQPGIMGGIGAALGNMFPSGQAQPLQQSQPAQPNFIDRLSAGANNMAAAPSIFSGLIDATRGFGSGVRTDKAGIALQNQKQMAQALHTALVQRGIPSQQAIGIATAAATDPKLAEVLLPQALGLKPPQTIEGVIAERMAGQNRGGQQGQGSFDPYGELKRLKQAEAEGSSAGKVVGETQATAKMDMPSAVAGAQEQLRLLDELKNHPGRKQIGWHDIAGSVPLVPSTKGYDAQVLLDQIKGGALLEAYKTLKGGVQITEIEGKKATAAVNRMERATSRAEFDRALEDYRGVIRLGIDRAEQKAGMEPSNKFEGNQGWLKVPGGRIRPMGQ